MKTSQHWYDLDARPHHGADLREARKHGYLPSVTSVLKCWPSDNLTRWKNEQMILAAITTPRLENEPDDCFVDRIMACADEESRNARDVGSRRHDLIEQFNKGAGVMGENPDLPFIQPYLEWFDQNVKRVMLAEEVIVHPAMGYGGKLDLLAELKDGSVAVIDPKNRKTLREYSTDCAQLAAYREPLNADRCISIILGTQRPEILVKEWTPSEAREGWIDFELALTMWKRSRQYWPERFRKEAAA